MFLNAEEEDVLETNDFMVVVEAIISISGDAVQERTEKRGMWKHCFVVSDDDMMTMMKMMLIYTRKDTNNIIHQIK